MMWRIRIFTEFSSSHNCYNHLDQRSCKDNQAKQNGAFENTSKSCEQCVASHHEQRCRLCSGWSTPTIWMLTVLGLGCIHTTSGPHQSSLVAVPRPSLQGGPSTAVWVHTWKRNWAQVISLAQYEPAEFKWTDQNNPGVKKPLDTMTCPGRFL